MSVSNILLYALILGLLTVALVVIVKTIFDSRKLKATKDEASKALQDIFSQFGVDLNEKKDDISIDFSDIGSDFDIVGIGSDGQFVQEHKSE